MHKRKISIFFGTETGNAQELAEKSAEILNSKNHETKVLNLEDTLPSDLGDTEFALFFVSTWGEGDQPDNAQDLYDDVCDSADDSMNGVSFAVLALGDTAFEMFCESGKEWDRILEEKGGTRIHERIDCDTDYEDFADEWIREALAKF